jgi:hypothetical protein
MITHLLRQVSPRLFVGHRQPVYRHRGISPERVSLLEFAFGFWRKVEWAGCRVKLWSFIRESRADGPALHLELERSKRFTFLMLLDFRLPLVGRFKTTVIWLKRR